MVEEIADVEQVVVCLRWVGEKLEVHEDFVGLYQVEAEKLYGAIILRSGVTAKCKQSSTEQCLLIAMVI